jgi:hypothetical protein
MLMQRQAPIAIGALAACAVIASGSILLREQILSFSSWPDARDGARGPEIAIPHGPPLAANGGAVAPVAGGAAARAVVRQQRDRAVLATLGLGPTGGSVAVPLQGRTPSAPSGAPAPVANDPSGPSLSTTGPTGSGRPSMTSSDPLSGYGDAPVAGDAAPVSGSGTKPKTPGTSVFQPTAASRTADPQVADVAPEADAVRVNSATDNAPPPLDPTEPVPAAPPPDPGPVETPAPPTETPAPPADPTPAPAEETPPADPAPPVETPPAPTPEEPATPPADPPPAEPAPEVPSAPADPTPPADPAPTTDPDPTATDAPQPEAAQPEAAADGVRGALARL